MGRGAPWSSSTSQLSSTLRLSCRCLNPKLYVKADFLFLFDLLVATLEVLSYCEEVSSWWHCGGWRGVA